jgi:predicted dehydrogenase
VKAETKLNVAVCGLGWWGSKILRNCARHSRVAQAIGVDPDPGRRSDMEKQFGVTTCASLAEAAGKAALNAAFIVTPPATHFPMVKQALLSGLHVVVAKPPTETLPELKELIALAHAKQLILMTDATFCYSPACRKLRSILSSGEIGPVRYVESVRYGDNLRVQGYSRLESAGRATQTDVIKDLVMHDLSLLLLLFGHDFKLDFASCAANIFPELAETAHIHLHTGDLRAHIALSWTMPERTRRLTIHGEKAILVWDDLSPDRRVWSMDTRGAAETIHPLEEAEPLYAMIDHFMACIDNGHEPDTGASLMLPAMQLIHSIEEFAP